MREPRKTKRWDELPAKFSRAEREAYQFLWDCGRTGWVVDLMTKEVRTTTGRTHADLIAAKKAFLDGKF